MRVIKKEIHKSKLIPPNCPSDPRPIYYRRTNMQLYSWRSANVLFFLEHSATYDLKVSYSERYWKQNILKVSNLGELYCQPVEVFYSTFVKLNFHSPCVHAIDAVHELSTMKTMHPFHPCNISIRACHHLAVTQTQFSDISKE